MCFHDEVTAKPYTAEVAQDEEILATIIAAAQPAAGVHRTLQQGTWGAYASTKENDDALDGPACAVGVGLLYKGCTIPSLVDEPTEIFAKAYGVSEAYAVGISDGFEAMDSVHALAPPQYLHTDEDMIRYRLGYINHKGNTTDAYTGKPLTALYPGTVDEYLRGVAVGSAVAEALLDG